MNSHDPASERDLHATGESEGRGILPGDDAVGVSLGVISHEILGCPGVDIVEIDIESHCSQHISLVHRAQ